jgi:DNA-binding response OmpR family regulator
MAAKVMVVDDEETMFEYIKVGLRINGFDVVGTANALEAVQMAHLEKPDIIILDCVMPGIDGFSICKGLAVSSITKNIPVLFITGCMTRIIRDKISQTSAKGYMLKPFEVFDLSDRIKEILLKQSSAIKNQNTD